MQCPYYVHKALARAVRPAGRQGPRRPDGDRRRLRRQGGVSVDHRRPRGAAGVEVRPAGEADLRPRRGHGGDDQAAPVADAAPDGGRRATAGSSRWTSTSCIDGGAYCTLSPVVLSRGTIHAAGPYFCPNVRMRGRAVATNAPPHGAFRGFGAPQSIFALERHMDRVAAAVGLAPDEFRRRNFIQPGETSAVGQVMREPVDMAGAARSRAVELSDYHAKRARFDARSTRRCACKQGHRVRDVHARRRIHRLGRGSPRIGRRRRRRRRTAACACWRPAPRSARAPTRSSRRSPPTRSAFDCDDDRDRAAGHRRSCPTAARPSRRARAWSSASWSRPRRVGSTPTLIDSRARSTAPARATSSSARARDYIAQFGPLRAISQLPAAAGPALGRREVPGRRVRHVRVGRLRGGSRRSTRRRARRASTISSPCRKSGKVINPVLAAGQIEGGVAQAIGWALYEHVVWREAGWPTRR